MERRQVLLGTTSVLAGLAGCSALSPQSPMLDLTIFSDAESPYTVEFELFRIGESFRSKAYEEGINVEPLGEARRENVAEAQPYLVRYSVYENNRRPTDEDHVHYYPPENESDDSMTFDLTSTGILTRR